MKKLALSLALAAGVALAAPSTPARADGGATAAIIGAAVIGGAMLNHAACGAPVCWWWAPRPVPVYVAPAPWPFWPWWQPAVTVKPKGKKKK
jgi:uncharacterized membrane protein